MFYYDVEFWDELNQEPNVERGVVHGNSYGEAADKLIEYYGEHNVVTISLSEVEPVMSEEELIDMFEKENAN